MGKGKLKISGMLELLGMDTHIDTHTKTHRYTHTDTHRQTDTHRHTHTDTHTHTHTPDNEAKILLKLINGLYQIIVLFFVT